MRDYFDYFDYLLWSASVSEKMCPPCTGECHQGRQCSLAFKTANSNGSDQGIEMYPDSWQTVRTVVLYGLAAIGAVALCAVAGFVSAGFF